MKQRFLSLFLAVACALSLFSFGVFPAAEVQAGGIPDILLYEDNSGSTAFQISTNQGMKKFSELGQSKDFAGITVYLTADIDMSGVAYTPVPSFSGTFDGGYHVIERISVSTTNKNCGLFGTVNAKGVVRCLGVEGGSFKVTTNSADYRVGSFAGVVRGLVDECWSSAVLTGVASGSTNDISVGGIAGALIGGGIVQNSYFAGRATGVDHASGIADWCQGQYEGYVGQILNCFNIGRLSATTCYALGRYSGSILAANQPNAIKNSFYFDNYTTYSWATAAKKASKANLGSGYLAYVLNRDGSKVWSQGAMFPELRGKAGVYQLKINYNNKGYSSSASMYLNEGDTYTVQVPQGTAVSLSATAGSVSGNTFTMGAQNSTLTATVELPNIAQFTTYPNESVYVVTDPAGFTAMATAVNGGKTLSGKSIYMLGDINMSNAAHTPIGQFVSDSSWTKSFSGHFYGNNYKIYNLKVSNTSLNGGGLFGSCYQATIEGLHIFNGTVTTANRAGGIAGYADACTLRYCSNGADIKTTTGSDGAGGLAGVARKSSTFEYCANYGSVTATVKAAAGIAGWGQTNIKLLGCINTGVITAGSDAAALARVGSGYTGTWTECHYLKSACSTSVAGTARDENYFCTGIIAGSINTYNRSKENSGAYTATPRFPAIKTENEPAATCCRLYAYDDGVSIGYITVYGNVGDEVAATNSQDYYGGVHSLTANLTGKAYPQPILYSISCSLNGGTLTETAPTQYSYAAGAALPLGTELQKNGYCFAGWYESSALTGQPTAVVGPKVRGDKTYYAKWSAPVDIGTTEQYLSFVKAVNAGDSYSSKFVRITADLDFGGQTIPALGTATAPFCGVLDGGGHSLSNFTISGADAQGLVGYLKQGTVQFLKLENCTVSGKTNTGSVVGYNDSGLILGCESSAAVINTSSIADLSYMSFNIRCGEDPSPNTVSERTPRVKTYLANYAPDIIGLQEVTPTWKSVLSTALSGYSSEFTYRDTSNKEAAPLYWKSSKFTALEKGTFWLSTTPDSISLGWGATHYRTCSYAVLQPKNTDIIILAYNTHLDHQSEQARNEGIKLVKTRMDAMETKYRNKGYTNIYSMVTGDFNAKPGTVAANYLSSTMVEARNNAVSLGTPVNQNTFSAYNASPTSIIDYLFVSRNTDVKTYKVTLDKVNGNAVSDHYGLFGTVRLGGNSQGGVVGYNKGHVQSCGFTGSIQSTAGCGGIAGYNAGKIVGSYSKFSPNASGVFVGGIAPKVEGSVAFSYYTSNAGLSGSGSTTADLTNSSYLPTMNRLLKLWSMESSVNNGLPFICLKHEFVYKDNGNGTHSGSCSLCGASVTENHKAVTDKAMAPTCTAAGKTEGSHCELCKLVIVAQQTVPAKGHSYTSTVTTEATCTAAGVRTYTCGACSHSYTEAIPATNHSYSSKVTKEATCTAAGVKTFTCSNCSHSYTESIPAKGHTEVTVPGYAATCLESGMTDGVSCSVCQAVIKAQETIPRLGHDYKYTDNGDGTHKGSCSRCSKVLSNQAHTMESGSCSLCGAVDSTPKVDESIIIRHSLNLASDISINYVVETTLLSGYDSFYLSCAIPVYEGNTYKGSSTVTIQPELKGGYYYFTLNGLTAVQIGDSIEATLNMQKDSRSYLSKADSYSIATYAYAQLNKTDVDASLKCLCAELLRYGAKAQIFKSYRTNALADASLTTGQTAYLADLNGVSFGNNNKGLNDLSSPTITWVGKSLDLNSKVTLKYVFNASGYDGKIADLTLRVSYEDVNGNSVQHTLSGAKSYNPSLGWYTFDLDSLLAAELRSVVSVAIYSGNTRLSTTMVYSADTYANGKTGNLLALCKALFAYSDSAKAFFAK